MDKFEGTTTISSHEYRQLIEDLAFFKNLYDRVEREQTELNEAFAHLREAHEKLKEDYESEKSMAAYYRQKSANLLDEIDLLKGVEVSHG